MEFVGDHFPPVFDFALGVLAGAPVEGVVVVVVPGDEVEVKMRDDLSGAGAVGLVDVEAVGVCGGDDRAREARHEPAEMRGEFFGQVREAFAVLFGDEEQVAGADGADIHEGKREVVFVDAPGGDLAGDDFTENAVLHGDLRER